MKRVYIAKMQTWCFAFLSLLCVTTSSLHAQVLPVSENRTSSSEEVKAGFPLFGEQINYQYARSEDAIQDAVFFNLNQSSLSK